METYQDEQRTIDLACELDPAYAQFSVLSPFYGTKVYEDAVSKGWYADVDAGGPVDKDLKRAAVLSPNWTEAALRRILREAHRRFYFRPRYLLGRLATIGSFGKLVMYFRTWLKMVFWIRRAGSER